MTSVQIEVTVYDDGGTSVTVPPIADERFSAVLNAAADALARHAGFHDREREQVRCPVCGVDVLGVSAAASGAADFRPCGHLAS